MTARNSLFFWLGAFGLFLGFVFVFKGILLPFILGFAVAYLLNPAVGFLSRIRLARGPAALFILFAFLLFSAALFAAITPVVYQQVIDLSRDVPGDIEAAVDWLEPRLREILALAGIQSPADMKALASQYAAPAFDIANFSAGYLIKGLAAGGHAVANLLSIVVIMPVVAYFMMKEWPAIMRHVKDLLPRTKEAEIMRILKEIDQKLAGFIRGQLTVMLILGIGYALALSLAGLKYGFLIGLGAGLLSIIPLVGSTVGLLIGVLVAWAQTSGDWGFVAIIAGIFLVGQIIEGNFLTPKLMGDSIGLHPLWIFFALMAGGSLMGFVGILIAVPVAAVLSVLIAFAVRQYRASPYYTDPAHQASPHEEQQEP